jgi:hypothetical protein
MPANLTPEYLEAERNFRAAKTDEERLVCLEQMLRTLPKHKGTEKMQADIRRRISKIKIKQEEEEAKKASKKGSAHRLKKDGCPAVALVGTPNTGKSRLLASLTHAEPEVAPYPFTTRTEYPAIMQYEDVSVMLVDLPPVIPGNVEHWVYEIIRVCEGMLLLVDLQAPDPTEQYAQALQALEQGYIFAIPPDRTPELHFRNRYLRTWLIAGKFDGDGVEMLDLFKDTIKTDLPIFPLSAESGLGVSEIQPKIWEMLGRVRAYSKPPGKTPDMKAPFTLPKGSTIAELAEAVHRELAGQVKSARVWGGARFDGQHVGRDYVIQDGDVVELHT